LVSAASRWIRRVQFVSGTLAAMTPVILCTGGSPSIPRPADTASQMPRSIRSYCSVPIISEGRMASTGRQARYSYTLNPASARAGGFGSRDCSSSASLGACLRCRRHVHLRARRHMRWHGRRAAAGSRSGRSAHQLHQYPYGPTGLFSVPGRAGVKGRRRKGWRSSGRLPRISCPAHSGSRVPGGTLERRYRHEE